MRLRAEAITLGASRDATIFQNNPDNGSGAGNGLFSGTNGAGSPRRALIAFDLSAMPRDVVIQSAVLTLHLGQVAGSGGGVPGGGTDASAIALHRVTSDWGEGATQKRDPPSDVLAGVGQGAAAEAGDVTWLERFFAASPAKTWDVAGGDFEASASASLSVGRTTDAPYAWPSTPAIVQDVQQWTTEPATNFGWILINEDEVSSTTFRAFYSRDAATAVFHPSLTITYSKTPSVTADFDDNGVVEGADFLAWQRGLLASTGGRSEGDANGDGLVSAVDLEIWKQQFGVRSQAMRSIPEPALQFTLAPVLFVAVATVRNPKTSLSRFAH